MNNCASDPVTKYGLSPPYLLGSKNFPSDTDNNAPPVFVVWKSGLLYASLHLGCNSAVDTTKSSGWVADSCNTLKFHYF